jgi:hypothetical protein
MANRMLRDWTDSDKVNSLNVHSERFFTRLIMKVDDYGCFHADTRLLKAHLYPLLLDSIREADLLRWMAECQKAGLIVLYESSNKKYLQIKEFKQRLDKARSKYPLPESVPLSETFVHEFPAELEAELELERIHTPIGDVRPDYSKVEKTKAAVYDYIKTNKPTNVEPYKDLWNLFASETGLSPIKKINTTRQKKWNIRIKEESFDFVGVLRLAKDSEFIRSGSWFGFDWVIENDSNYLKVLEGNYRGAKAELKPLNTSPTPAELKAQRILNGED